jgi:S-adenosylmethionine:tRNA ribosyltransferase-isomerase
MAFLDYALPSHLIAQHPAGRRDESRLMVLHRERGSIDHRHFSDLPQLLRSGDRLVLNDTRVLPARLYGRRARTGGKWEGLFTGEVDGIWELMCQTRGTLTAGEWIEIDPAPLRLQLLEHNLDGTWSARPDPPGPAHELLSQHGRMPLPPYIRKGQAGSADADRYQTIFANRAGAIAAPTAGLHFTQDVFDALTVRGIAMTRLTLHVGAGTFQPIRVDDFREHPMHYEWGELSAETAAAINATRAAGGRIVAVGTTSVRVLETVAASGPIPAWSGSTNLFIYPPYEFRAVDVLLTNFHLPRSTLLLLVGAFAGEKLLATAYREAIAREYRFYSYGDAMLIV